MSIGTFDDLNNTLKHGTIILLDILGTKKKSKNIQQYFNDIQKLYSALDEIKISAEKMLCCMIPLFQIHLANLII